MPIPSKSTARRCAPFSRYLTDHKESKPRGSAIGSSEQRYCQRTAPVNRAADLSKAVGGWCSRHGRPGRHRPYGRFEEGLRMAVEEGRAVTGYDREPVARPPKTPKRWKQFCITLAGVYPLTVAIPITLTWLSHFVPSLTVFAIRDMVSATLLVTCLMCVILPLFNKLFRRWLTR
jgi:hypothetical protein